MREGKGKSLISFPENFCVVDIETTGLDYSCDIIEVSALKIRNEKVVDSYSNLIRPESYYLDGNQRVYIDEFISELTGITNDMLDSANSLVDVIPGFRDFIGSDIIIGHNVVSFDANFLYDTFSKHLNTVFSNDLVDTMRLSRWIVPDLDHHRLVDLAHLFSLETSGMHRGLKDCEITLQCFYGLKDIAIKNFGNIDSFVKYTKERLKKTSLRAKDIVSQTSDFDISNPIYGSVCVFTGTLERMSRREAMQIVKNLGGNNGESVTKKTNYLVLGNNDFCKSIKDGKSNKQKKAEKLKASGVDIEIISESVFYDMAGIN